MLDRSRSLLGLVLLLAVAYAVCPRARRSAVAWRCVGWGVALQFIFAVLILKVPIFRPFFDGCKALVNGLLAHAAEGGRMVFGPLMDVDAAGGVIFAIQTLVPVIVFFASVMAVLYQLGLMQRVVGFIARVMMRFMGTSGAETLSAVGNIFVGMTEAPLMIRPYLDRMTRSEILTMMIGGMCTVAGTVMAVYVSMLQTSIPDIAGHLIIASVLSAPAGLAIAKLMLPETEEPETRGRADIAAGRLHSNVIDAVTGGAGEGLKLAGNVIAMLIAMIALISLLNASLSWPARAVNQRALAALADAGVAAEALPEADDAAAIRGLTAAHGIDPPVWRPLTAERIGSWLFTPLAWCLGTPTADVPRAARLLSEKTVLNEFIAYQDMAATLEADPSAITPRGRLILSYALCGFANFGSVAIMIGGIGGLAPARRRDLAELGLHSLLGGTLAACMTACVVGVLS